MSTLHHSGFTSPEVFNSLDDPERAGVKRKADAQGSDPSTVSGSAVSKSIAALSNSKKTQSQVFKKPEEILARTVQVSGLKADFLSKQILEVYRYFRNRKISGGGPIASIAVEEKHGTALVTFQSAEGSQGMAASASTTRSYKQAAQAAASQSMAPQGRSHITEVQEALQQQHISHSTEMGAASSDTTVSSQQVVDVPRAATLMSEEDKDLLSSQLPQLVSNIGIEDGMLLAHLRARGALTKYGEEKIKSEGDRSNQVGCLLDLLLRGDSSTVDKLVYSLRDTGQLHLGDKWLRKPRPPDSWEQIDTQGAGFGATTYLSQADTNLLERYRPRLMGDLNMGDGSLLAELRARSVLTENEEWFIKEIPGNGNAVAYLVDLLLCKSPDSLEGFLQACNQSGYSVVADYLRPTASLDGTCFVRGGSSTIELEYALRVNLADRLSEWKTALEDGSIGRGETLHYIDQPCSVETKNGWKYTEDRAIQVVEESVPGDRIVVYGEAGSGKTMLLKELTQSWFERKNYELVEKFKYLFLIPCHLIRNVSLLNIICDELGLFPTSSRNELKKALDFNETSVLFLTDSYEELRGDVARADVTDIDDLISSRLFSKSTVIVTSCPGSGPRQSEHQKTAHLKDLPGEKVEEVLRERFDEDKEAADCVLKSFSTMSLMQKPINLALFLFNIKHSKHLQFASTQAELLNFSLQNFMLAFARKKKLNEFTPQPGSYILNRDIPKGILCLFRDMAKRCFEERKDNNVILHLEGAAETKEYLDFDLFTTGPDTHSVVLPHALFQEYLAGVYLAEEPKALAALFEEIREKSESASDKESESGSNRPLLVDVLRPMGVDNVVRFLVALRPQVCEQISELIVVEREKIEGCDNYRLVNFEFYTELIKDCGDESGKHVLATGLLNAAVRDGVGHGTESGSIVLWPHLTDDQRVTFLRKVYNFDLRHFDDKFVISCPDVKITDKFVVAFVHLYNCTISAQKLIIEGEEDCCLDLPAGMLSRKIPTVRQLRLEYCSLCEGVPDYMSDINRPAALQPSGAYLTNSSLERVELHGVRGLEHSDVITSHECQVMMEQCVDVRVSTLRTCFPKMSELAVDDETKVVHATKKELTPWLSTVQVVRQLQLAPQHELMRESH